MRRHLAIAACACGFFPPSSTKADVSTTQVACVVHAVDSDGRSLDLFRSHASVSSTLPPELAREVGAGVDAEAIEWQLECPKGGLPSAIRIESRRPGGGVLDTLEAVSIAKIACPKAPPELSECGHTKPIRASPDWADRVHPAAAERSVLAEVGGRLVLEISGRPAASIMIGGPRHTSLGVVDRFRARLRIHVLRASSGGLPAVGGDDEGAREVVWGEVRTASMLWGQCGIHFGPERDVSVDVVDPPPRYLLAIGCEVGLPASGGELRFSIGKSTVRVVTHSGEAPVEIAHDAARALQTAGFRATVSPNARVAQGAFRTADVLVRKADGSLVDLTPVGSNPLSTDPTLPVCIGNVDLASGLRHFQDLDAASGTLEERTLVKAYEDGDPSTIDVFIVPSFEKTGRIGESFIDGDGSSIQNVVIVDRLAILSGSRAYALPHELGHVLLDMPGHPDDYGVDRPWALMDADAADSSIYGPRRLSAEDCERAIKQSGPGASVQLLTPWPLH